MATKFVDQLGISHIFSKIKTLLSGKADNDLSNINASSGRTNLGLNDAIVGLSVSGKKITYTQADGGTGTITTQDTNTTYSAMSASEATTGTATTSRSMTAKVLHDKINEVVTAKAYSHPSTHPASMITGLSTVATSGSYDDLSNKPTIPSAYTLPNATSSTLGGVKVGTNISVSSGTISVANGSTSAKGVVQLSSSTSSTSTSLAATASAVKSAYDLANGKQSPATTLAGYGITNAYTKTEVDAKIPTSLPANGGNADTVGGFTVGTNVPADAKFTDTVYTLPNASSSTKGGVKIGSNITVSSGTISLTKSNVTSALGYTPPTTNTTYSDATTSAAGLMSATDKAKLDGIASGANAYSLPTASSTLGGVKTTSTVTSTSGLTACPIIGGVPYYKDTNNTYSLSSFSVTATASELNVLDGITATTAELNYCDGVTSNIQTQLNGKLSTSGTAAKATADASGNNIVNTYAKKTELAVAATTDEIDAILV